MNEFYPTPPGKVEQPALLKRKQTYAEYVATFVPYKPSPRVEKIGNFFGKVGVCLLALFVLFVIVMLW